MGMVVTTLHLLYEITFAPATGPYARTTLPTTPLEVNATVKSSPASSSATRKATVGPDPETNAPSAPYSWPTSRTNRNAGRNEHAGVTEECRNLADGNFIIPQMGIIQSLNISVACAVSIYEAMRQKMNAGHYEKASLPQAQMDTLLTQWGFEEETPEVYNSSKLKRS